MDGFHLQYYFCHHGRWRCQMNNERHILDESDERILNLMKVFITKGVTELQERGVRPANIEIELVWHIKKLLKGD